MSDDNTSQTVTPLAFASTQYCSIGVFTRSPNISILKPTKFTTIMINNELIASMAELKRVLGLLFGKVLRSKSSAHEVRNRDEI